MAIDLDLIDKLLADYKKPEDIIGENGFISLPRADLASALGGACQGIPDHFTCRSARSCRTAQIRS